MTYRKKIENRLVKAIELLEKHELGYKINIVKYDVRCINDSSGFGTSLFVETYIDIEYELRDKTSGDVVSFGNINLTDEDNYGAGIYEHFIGSHISMFEVILNELHKKEFLIIGSRDIEEDFEDESFESENNNDDVNYEDEDEDEKCYYVSSSNISKSTINDIIESLVDDIKDRRGLKHEWNAIDSDVKEEIKLKWFTIMDEILNGL